MHGYKTVLPKRLVEYPQPFNLFDVFQCYSTGQLSTKTFIGKK